jgi:hypothetical protein
MVRTSWRFKMKRTIALIIVLFLSGCSGTLVSLSVEDSHPEIRQHFRLGQDHFGKWPYGAKKDCIDAILINATNNSSQYNACGFPVPDLRCYKVVSMEYVPMPDDLKGKMYVVAFKDKQGDVVFKGYHKTHPMTYTIQRAGEEPYTIVDTTCREVYDTKYFGKYEVPKCVLELYSKARAGGYLPEQFEDQESFIKLRSPEPDDFNPYEGASLSAGKQWKKACEWWDEDSLRN